MNDYHFEYSGKVIIAADTYEEAEKLLKNMMWDVRGVYNYQMINSSVSVLADDGDEEQMTETDISTVLIEGEYATIMGVKYKRVEEPKPTTLWGIMREELGFSVDMADEIVDAVEGWLPDEVEVDTEEYNAGWNASFTEIKGKLR